MTDEEGRAGVAVFRVLKYYRPSGSSCYSELILLYNRSRFLYELILLKSWNWNSFDIKHQALTRFLLFAEGKKCTITQTDHKPINQGRILHPFS